MRSAQGRQKAFHHIIYIFSPACMPSKPGCVSTVCMFLACMGTAVMLSALKALLTCCSRGETVGMLLASRLVASGVSGMGSCSASLPAQITITLLSVIFKELHAFRTQTDIPNLIRQTCKFAACSIIWNHLLSPRVCSNRQNAWAADIVAHQSIQQIASGVE